MFRRLSTLGAAGVLMCALMCGTAQAASVPFSDVPETEPYFEEVMYCRDVGITVGIGDNQFVPDLDVSMSQVCTMLLRAYYPDELQDGMSAVRICYDKGWLGETSLMSPDTGILLRNLVRLLFHVADIPIYTENPMDTAVELGLYPEGDDGDRQASRADCAYLLGRLLTNEYVVEEPDVYDYLNVTVEPGYEDVAVKSMSSILELPESILIRWHDLGNELVFGETHIQDFIERENYEGIVGGLYYTDGIELKNSYSAVHEFGHFVYYQTGFFDVRSLTDDYFEKYQDIISSCVSAYAITNEQEFFAECFELYMGNGEFGATRERMAEQMPDMYDLLVNLEEKDWGMVYPLDTSGLMD